MPIPYNDPSGHVLTPESYPSQSFRRFEESLESRSIFPLPQTPESRRWQRLSEIGTMSIFRRRPHTNTTPNVQSDSVEYPNPKDKEEPKDARVVMIVKMPSLTKPRYHRAGHKRRSSHYSFLSNSETLVENTSQIQEDLSGSHHDSGQFQYCIGFHTCPWPLSIKSNNDAERMPHSHAEKELG